MGSQQSIAWIMPELAVIMGAFIVLMLALSSNVKRDLYGLSIAIFTLILAFCFLLTQTLGDRTYWLFMGSLVLDPFAQVLGGFFMIITLVAVVSVFDDKQVKDTGCTEYVALILILLLGMLLLIKASNLLMIYLSLELVSIPSYILVAFLPKSRESQEAGLKYVMFGALTSGIFLFGLSLIYGLSGTVNIYEFPAAIAQRNVSDLSVIAAFALITVGFGFKITMFPFQSWAPDVYQGAPTSFTAFLSVGPKAAGFAIFTRVIMVMLEPLGGNLFLEAVPSKFYLLIALLSVATMTFGNLAALSQTNVKRMLAYSSIAHAGYALMALAIPGGKGVSGLVFYLLVYGIMNMGAFLTVAFLSRAKKCETLTDYDGLGYHMPLVGAMFTIFLFSLTGIPPTVGFVGKLVLFSKVIEAGLLWLVIIAVLNTVVSFYYYARVIKAMYLGSDVSLSPPPPLSPIHMYTLGFLGVFTILLGIFWDPILYLAINSEHLYR